MNRVGDRFFSQLDRLPGTLSLEDLDRVASLGVRALRFPVLWERVAPDGDLARADWSWSDARLARLRELGITPIVGLVHHGSGPRHTSLADPRFAERLAGFAARVAARYPWVTHYTPVNEPLTTARFSGLYGLWYPHGRDERTFGGVLLNQCRGIVLAMRAIQAIVPDAQLVQTDDLGATHGTARLRYQAAFNNEMRWLAWDLLCGTVSPGHPLWDWLVDCAGVAADALHWHRQHPRRPDIIGANHYVTSERFLDHRLDRYPPHTHGGNGRDRYADVEAVRVLARASGGVGPLLLEAWRRYGVPMAVTEAHIDAPREDQMRWFAEIWRDAEAARRAGADVRAVTAWSLFGAHDWNSLLTRDEGYYESGAFDVRGGRVRATALAHTIAEFGHGRTPSHPALCGAGWWRRPIRLIAPPGVRRDLPRARTPPACPPVLITGATGTLGTAFARICAMRDLPYMLLGRADLDIAHAGSVAAALDRFAPWVVINAAGYVRVDDAERERGRCFRENAEGAAVLAAACARHGVPLATFSTDLVFDGAREAPYVETDIPAPLNVYGHSKREAEQRVLELHPGALVVRTSAFFGPWDNYNFVTASLQALAQGRVVRAARDLVVSPTYVPDLVHACLDLLIDGEHGLCHLTNGEPSTWLDLAATAAKLADVDASRLVGCEARALHYVAARPRYSALGSERAFCMPPLGDALARYLEAMPEPGPARAAC